jgi:serine/threonine-protein kinase HipA
VRATDSTAIDEAVVLLSGVVIGSLSCQRGPDKIAFRFSQSYRETWPRPVLGQVFETDLGRVEESRIVVPTWFSHLLPEGPLRRILAEHANVSPEREFYLLSRLGDDLAGAVQVRPQGDWASPRGSRARDEPAERDELRLSLAGLQLKLSAVEDSLGLTIPARGQGGTWIVKLPGSLPGMPENEAAVLAWARASGIEVPDHRLVDLRDIRRMPAEFPQLGTALVIRRYDRVAGRLVHQEDFAQVLGKPAGEHGKYEGRYETMGAIVLARAGLEDFRSLVRRLVFVVLSNNSDAHLKNWAMIYPDGIRPRLAPAYDLAFAGAYPGYGNKLALRLNGLDRFEAVRAVDLQGFAQTALAKAISRMASPPPLTLADVLGWVREDVERALDAWSSLRSTLPLDEPAKIRLDQYLTRLPLARRA